MRSVQPTLKNGRNLWDPATLPESEFRDRLERVRRGMKRDSLDLLLVCGRAFDNKAGPCYLSNYVIRLPKSTMMAVPVEGAPALFFEGSSRGLSSMRKTTWVEDLRAGGDVVKICEAYLEERKWPSRVGIAGARRLLPHGQYRALSALLDGSETTEADALLNELREIKSAREIERVRAAAAIVAAMFERLCTAPFDDSVERTVEAQVRLEARRRGAEDVRMMIARPQGSAWNMRPPENRALEAGERVAIYAAAEYERYWAAAIRTLEFNAGAFAVAADDAVSQTYPAVQETLVPGRAVSDVLRRISETCDGKGLDRIASYGLGQGIGLALEERPYLREDVDGEIRSGQCLSLNLAARRPGPGFIVGDTFVVTAEGTERVT